MNRSLYFIFILIIFFFNSCSRNEDSNLQEKKTIVPIETKYGIPVDVYTEKKGSVKRNDYFVKIMVRLGLNYDQAYVASRACDGVFDLRKVKVGNKFISYYTKEENPQLAYWRYENDSQSYVVISILDSIAVKLVPKDVKKETKYAKVIIKNSLWEDVLDAGVSPQVALAISDVYQWEIDFFGLRPGDSFKVLYDQTSYNERVLYVDKIHYAVFNHEKKDYFAYWFDQEDGSNNRYWDQKGESLRKAFLKSPLNFTRISSGFSYARRHPITRRVRPHTGIDYAAPTGTPVLSIGDGVVIQKGYKGGGGHTVKIRHTSVYSSAYLHLSRYGRGIRNGAKVKQGQVIGYVGSTGMSTGPHLDFRIWRNGSPINPLRMKSPSIEPLKKKNTEKFLDKIKDYESYQDRFNANIILLDYINRLSSSN